MISILGITLAGTLVFEEIRLSLMFGRVVWMILITSRFFFALIYNTIIAKLSLTGIDSERKQFASSLHVAQVTGSLHA